MKAMSLIRRVHPLLAAAIAYVLLAAAASSASSTAGSPGEVRFVKGAESGFDTFTRRPTAAQRSFMRSHYWRLRTYSPYFDSRLRWAPAAWAYQNAYAIYPSSPEASAHPNWILRDTSGAKLWIQFACANGACTQYAADIGDPSFRAWWIAAAKAKLAAGYRGIYIDDVNMGERVSDGDGVFKLPVDPRTHAPLDERAWQHYMAEFMGQVRKALPGAEIIHNVLWPQGDATADLRSELRAADYVELEHGFGDRGIVAGHGKFGFETLLRFVAHRHAAGTGVIFGGSGTSMADRLYALASYFLVSAGNDALDYDVASTPDDWWAGYGVQLGDAAGPGRRSQGVWRRDFVDGAVLVNEPGSPVRTIQVGSGYRDLSGIVRTSVRLGPTSGIVLLRRS